MYHSVFQTDTSIGIALVFKGSMKRFAYCILISALFNSILVGQHGASPFSEKDFNSYMASQKFSGAVLVKNAKGEVFQIIKGTADLEEIQPIDPNAKFRIASITKLFTAVIVMQLVDEKKLSLESTLDDFLDYEGIAFADQITVKDLLQHTSGLRKESSLSYLKAYTHDQLIEKYATKKAAKPGQKHYYNNLDYILLGRIIEVSSAKSFEENLQSRILQPLKMNNTGLITDQALPEGVVPDFKVKAGQRKESLNIHIENFWAAGSMFSTVSDLLSFVEALKTGKLVSQDNMKPMFTSSPSLGYAALGCWTFNSPFIDNKPRVMERRGGILGSTSAIMTHLDGPETVIILSNTNEFNPDTFGVQDNLKEYLFKRIFE